VTTAPTNLAVNVTYDGSGNAPTNAGSYAVVATVTDANYSGGATNTLVVNPGTALVTLGDLIQTYDGTAKIASVTTSPTNLAVSVSYDGNTSAPTNKGSYAVVATVADANYIGGVTNTLVIDPGTAVVLLGDLSQTYDGAAKTVSVTTLPTNLVVSVTYDGSASAPTNAGSYVVVATINEPNYQGSATNTLTIETLVCPSLQIRLINEEVIVTWPQAFSNYTLQGTLGIGSGVWNTNLGLPIVNGTNLQLTLPAANPAQFYRLVR